MITDFDMTMIAISLVGLILSIVYIFIYKKEKGTYYLLSAILWLLNPVLTVIGALTAFDYLIVCAICFPIGLNVLATLIELILRYKNCTLVVSSKCDSFTSQGRGMYYVPKFSYWFDGKFISSATFIGYYKRKFKRMFTVGNSYEIYINPNKPTQCVDKRSYPLSNHIFLGLIAAFFLLFPIVIVII